MDFFEFAYYFFIYSAILTYLAWGLIIGFEAILALSSSKFAINWIKAHHRPKTFQYMLIIFLPMLYFCYIFLEIIPFLLKIDDKLAKFDLEKIYKNIYITQI